MKSTWCIIKEEMVKETVNGSTGYFIEVKRAAVLYNAIKENLVDQPQSQIEFKNDLEVKQAFSMKLDMLK